VVARQSFTKTLSLRATITYLYWLWSPSTKCLTSAWRAGGAYKGTRNQLYTARARHQQADSNAHPPHTLPGVRFCLQKRGGILIESLQPMSASVATRFCRQLRAACSTAHLYGFEAGDTCIMWLIALPHTYIVLQPPRNSAICPSETLASFDGGVGFACHWDGFSPQPVCGAGEMCTAPWRFDSNQSSH